MNLLFLAWTYFKRRLLLSMSALSIALGVGVLFAVLAVVNGFLAKFEETLRDFGGDVVVRPARSEASSPRGAGAYLDVILGVPGVRDAFPRANWFGLVGRRGTRALDDPRTADLNGLLLVGLDPEKEKEDFLLGEGRATEDLVRLLPAEPAGMPPLILGEGFAERLGVQAGDALEVISHHAPAGRTPYPVRATFEVTGTFKTGQFEQDLDRAVARRSDLVRFAGSETDFTELVVRTDEDADPETVAAAINAALRRAGIGGTRDTMAATWRAQRSNLLAAVENQRGILGTIFFFIVLVAAYQLVATLILTVAEKRRDIGVLGALGATPGRIASFFVSLGFVIAASGLALGLLLGMWITSNLETIENFISGGEGIFHPEVYLFDEIPTTVHTGSVLLLVAATLAASLIFSLIPAWRAARLPIVRAMHAA